MRGEYIRVLVCPVCGKKFVPASMHIYKVQTNLVCSWGCQRKVEKEQEARKKKGGKKRVENNM